MKKKNGFTLIELLATIVILVAILAIAINNPSHSSFRISAFSLSNLHSLIKHSHS